MVSKRTSEGKNDGYMRGNLVELTVGGYLFNQVGIITGINYTVPMESPWEIAIGDEATATVNTISNTLGSRDINQPIQADNTVKELPMIIKVSGFSFIPIHNFVPNLQVNGYGGGDSDDTGVATSYGEQRYIALSNKFYNNYDDFI